MDISIKSRNLSKHKQLLHAIKRFSARSFKGVAIIEFAIAIPLLILLLFILFECGRLYTVYIRFTEMSWEGARFFSSLKDPIPACIDEEVTNNIAYASSNYYDTLSEQQQKVYMFHKVVHERVVSLFLYKKDSWPIESSGIIPGSGYPGIKIKDHGAFGNLPSIATQYIENKDNSTQNCPPPQGLSSAIDNPKNTVTVCLEADYLGFFFNIPLRSCSSSHLLDNNEILRVPLRRGPYRSG